MKSFDEFMNEEVDFTKSLSGDDCEVGDIVKVFNPFHPLHNKRAKIIWKAKDGSNVKIEHEGKEYVIPPKQLMHRG